MENKQIDKQELEFLILLKGRVNNKEYLFLLHRARYKNESIADSARRIGIKENHARKIASRLRQKINDVLGIEKK